MDYDVIVVGAGSAGLSAALTLGRCRRRVLLADGGAPRNAPSPAVHGFLTRDGLRPAKLLELGRQQLAPYPTIDVRELKITKLHKLAKGFRAEGTTGQGHAWAGTTHRVLLATGVEDVLPALPGFRDLWGTGVLHCPYCHGYEVRDVPLGVIAAQPMSAHQALLIPDWGPTTYFTQGQFEPEAEELAAFAARGIIVERTPVVELMGDAPALDGVRLADGRFVEVTAVFTAPQTKPSTPLAEILGCAHEDGPTGPYVKVDSWGATSVPGVWAAGDAATPMHNATLASAAGVLAGIGVHQASVRAKAA